MPRVSQKEAQKTRERIIKVAQELLMSDGFEALTFTRIAKAANIGRSSINSHFKKKKDLIDEIRPYLTAIVDQHLDFSSGEKFYASWVLAIKQDRVFRQVINSISIVMNTDAGVDGFKARLQGDPAAEQYIYMAIGYAVVNLPHYD